MKHPARRALVLGLPLSVLLAACQSSPTPTLYTLGPVPGPVLTGGARTVVVREIGNARYLERPNVVRSSEGYQLDVMPNDLWGEPVGSMITRTFVQELAQRLQGSTVLAETGAIGISPDVLVEVNVLRFDSDHNNTVVLNAQYGVTRPGSGKPPIARAADIHAPMPSPATPGQVAAMSDALGQLADQVARLVVGG